MVFNFIAEILLRKDPHGIIQNDTLMGQTPVLPSLFILSTNGKQKWKPKIKPLCTVLGAK